MVSAIKFVHVESDWYEACNSFDTVVTLQMNFPRKITFDMLYTNKFLIRVRSRALSIPSERNTI